MPSPAVRKGGAVNCERDSSFAGEIRAQRLSSTPQSHMSQESAANASTVDLRLPHKRRPLGGPLQLGSQRRQHAGHTMEPFHASLAASGSCGGNPLRCSFLSRWRVRVAEYDKPAADVQRRLREKWIARSSTAN